MYYLGYTVNIKYSECLELGLNIYFNKFYFKNTRSLKYFRIVKQQKISDLGHQLLLLLFTAGSLKSIYLFIHPSVCTSVSTVAYIVF